MTLQRALELCLNPIEQRRDHRVKVDRYALKHVLSDREEKIAELTSAKASLTNTGKSLETAMEQIATLKTELANAKAKPEITVIP